MAFLISKCLNAGDILLDFQATSAVEAIRAVAEQLADSPHVLNIERLTDDIRAREEVESTYLGNGIAFPHARSEHVKELVIAVGRSNEGVRFENCGETVHLLFVIGTPKRLAKEYLAVVGALARLTKDGSVRRALMEVETADAFLEVVKKNES